MSYVSKNLLKNEEIVYRAKIHWFIYAPAILWFFFGLLFMANKDTQTFAAILISIGIFSFLKAVIKQFTSEYVITNKRLILKIGLISRNSSELMLKQLENVLVDQTIMGRLFNYGAINVQGTGISNKPFADIESPMKFKIAIQEAVEEV